MITFDDTEKDIGPDDIFRFSWIRHVRGLYAPYQKDKIVPYCDLCSDRHYDRNYLWVLGEDCHISLCGISGKAHPFDIEAWDGVQWVRVKKDIIISMK